MRKLFVLFLFTLGFTSCDDGDIITTELEFDDTFEACGELVLFKTKSDPNESLSLQITSPIITIETLIQTEVDPDNDLLVVLETTESAEIAIGTNNQFNFRSYTNAPINLFCNDVPPTNVLVTEDFFSVSGIAQFITELVEDDDDGIPAEFEDINGNGDLFDDDTDGDGLPNFLDVDDDGDNVLTENESVNFTEADGLTNALDTDGNGVPNYLDNDDDGDGVPTRNEEVNSQDQNPTNDITDNTVGADYLNAIITNNIAATAYRPHSVNQTFIVRVVLENIQFPNIEYETLDFGTLTTVDGVDILNLVRTITPPF